ncbi:MAG: lactate dehydrogenase [Alphaproteobacteria bacterium]|nr:MAG: lactate dehydrogenase [Alphaproteobacteria bacterium]
MALTDLERLERNENGIATAVAVLAQRFGDRLKTSMALREQHAHTTTYIPSQLPDAVVFATGEDDVRETVRVCAQYRVPVIPFGTGTSLEGGVNAPAGGISIDLTSMNRIVRVDAEDLDATVEAGVTREQLNSHLRDSGLFFPIDPGANASLGGMAATRASGTNAVRYGTMRENVIALRAVLPDGRVIRTAQRARKSAAGYDLTRLIVGSEGTLAIITELTLRLYGIPEAISAAICSFPDLESACNATILAMQSGLPMARIELMDASTVRAVNAYSRTDIPEQPLLLLEFHGSPAGVQEQTEAFGAIARDCGGSDFRWVTTTEERNRLWKARHDVYWAVRAAAPGKQAFATDVCVPISRLAECVAETERDIADSGLYGPIVGHVGDGNFHAAICCDPADADELGRAEAVVERLAMRALAMEGTCTGEHGIGQGKRRFLRLEHGPGVDVMAAIKKAIDPDNIMNPGKVLTA